MNSRCLLCIGAALLMVVVSGRAGFADPVSTQLPAHRSVFPADNPWNQRIDSLPVDPNSDAIVANMNPGRGLHPDFGSNMLYGIPFCVVSGSQPKVPVTFDYSGESDRGPYPIPPSAPIEGGAQSGGDRHILVIDRDNWKLYEVWNAHADGDGGWHCGSGAVFDLTSNALRPAGWTSADAAGLLIFPGLVRYDELVQKGEIDHAIRFTMRRTRRAYIWPATHYASRLTDPFLPPMGLRMRLKASVDISSFSPTVQVLLTAFKRYGIILADNGSDWFISGSSNPGFSDDDLHTLNRIKGSDFEVVNTGM